MMAVAQKMSESKFRMRSISFKLTMDRIIDTKFNSMQLFTGEKTAHQMHLKIKMQIHRSDENRRRKKQIIQMQEHLPLL